MDNFIRVYDNVITDEKCQYFIDKFESDTENHEIQNNSRGATLTQINLQHSPDTIWDDIKFLTVVFMEKVIKYKEDCDIQSYQWPKKFTIEPPKIKRYLPNTTDEFPEHVDVLDYKTARRFLVMFIYLNDNEQGETKVGTFISPCKRGSALLFPPMWPWAHAGTKPINKPKYIVGSYLHYP